ncbi:MAG: GNAT family N-acetyltransferase [Streptosporangiaceae bacterium]
MNGTQLGITIRPACGSDGEALRRFVAGLSLQTRYLRFFAGVPKLSAAMVRRMSGLELPGREPPDALVAVADGLIIGHAMASETRSPYGAAVTEIGVVVADGWQRHGVGTALLLSLATRAQARGAVTLMLDVLAENRDMLAMIISRFPAAWSRRAGPYVTVYVPLPIAQEEQSREFGAVLERELAGTG